MKVALTRWDGDILMEIWWEWGGKVQCPMAVK